MLDGGRASAWLAGMGDELDDEMSIRGGDRTSGAKIWIGAGGPLRVTLGLATPASAGPDGWEMPKEPAKAEACRGVTRDADQYEGYRLDEVGVGVHLSAKGGL